MKLSHDNVVKPHTPKEDKPPNKGHTKCTLSIVPCRGVVLFSEVTNVLSLWES